VMKEGVIYRNDRAPGGQPVAAKGESR